MFLLKLVLKNAFRHKLRAWLTILSITIAILAFGLLRTVIDAWYVGVESGVGQPPRHEERRLHDVLPAPLVQGKDRPGGGRHAGLLRELVRRRLYRREELFSEFRRRAQVLLRTLPGIRLLPRSAGGLFPGPERLSRRGGSSRSGSDGGSATRSRSRGPSIPATGSSCSAPSTRAGTRTWTSAYSFFTGTT